MPSLILTQTTTITKFLEAKKIKWFYFYYERDADGKKINSSIKVPPQYSSRTDKTTYTEWNKNPFNKDKDTRAKFDDLEEKPIWLDLKWSKYILFDTDKDDEGNQTADEKWSKIFADKSINMSKIKTKNGFHRYFKITDSGQPQIWNEMNETIWGNDFDDNVDIKPFTAWETDKRVFVDSQVPSYPISFKDFNTLIGDKKISTKVVKKVEKVVDNTPKIETIKVYKKSLEDKSYASLLITCFNVNDDCWSHYPMWIKLCNWCLIHHDFETFHKFSQKCGNYKGEEDCRNYWESQRKSTFRLGVGWGVNVAKQQNKSKWLRVYGDYTISQSQLTEYELALLLKKNYYDKFLAVGKKLYFYDGVVWIKDDDGKHFRKYLAEELFNELWKSVPQDDDAPKSFKELLLLRSTTKQNNIRTQFLGMVSESESIFIQKNGLFFFKNGVWDYEIKGLMKSDPNNYNLNFFDHDYNEKIMTDSRTIEIETMWEQVFPNEADLNFLKTAICKHLIGIMTKHIIFLKGSNGNNGKSTLLSLLVSALGNLATSFQGDILCKTITHSKPMPELAMLKDKLIVITQEPDTEEKFNTETIKSLTGGDVLHSRRLYENDPFELTNKALLISGCNSMPSFTKNDKALYGQRIRVIEIETEFVPPEEYEERKEEACVFLGDSKFNEPIWRKEAEVYMLHLLIKWLKQGYAERNLKQTASMISAKQTELEDSQELTMLNAVAERTGNSDDIIALNEIFNEIERKEQLMGKREWIKAIKTNVITAKDFKERHSKKRSVLKCWKPKEVEIQGSDHEEEEEEEEELETTDKFGLDDEPKEKYKPMTYKEKQAAFL